MEKHRCKLCLRNFANGKALGGHMRSHMMNLYASSKAKQEFIITEHEEEEQADLNVHDDREITISEEFDSVPSPSFLSSSSASSDEDEVEDEEINHPKKKTGALMMDQDFAVGNDSVVVQDRESETESSRINPSFRRSKRVRRSRISDFSMVSQQEVIKNPKSEEKQGRSFSVELVPFADAEPVSSISDTTSEEDVAYCLMMLSRDKWKKEEDEGIYGGAAEVEEKADHEEEKQKKEKEDAKKNQLFCHEFGVVKVTKSRRTSRGKYRCETCNKAFRSYQALGGHRASHKRIKALNCNSTEEEEELQAGVETGNHNAVVVEEKKIHECPFCYRVFSSGQALGGHKRSHVMGAAAVAAAAAKAAATTTHVSSGIKSSGTPAAAKQVSRFTEGFIDLNLPAPVDDDDISQVEHSAVSDAEFVNPFKQ